MQTAITIGEIKQLIANQLRNNFHLDTSEIPVLNEGIEQALTRAETCYANSTNKYFRKNGEVYFNPYHCDQYCIYLYWLARCIYECGEENRLLADRVYYLNRVMNSVDIFYEVKLPEIFSVGHPLGSVMGRASYGMFFSFSQGCTVGNNKGVYPVIGEHVKMFSNSKILGNCKIGNNVWISANSYIKDSDIPDNSIVFGTPNNLNIRQLTR